MPSRDPLENCTGFDWDEDNAEKNWERHKVTPEEAEDVFFHELRILRDSDHPFSTDPDHPFFPEADQRSPVKPIVVLL